MAHYLWFEHSSQMLLIVANTHATRYRAYRLILTHLRSCLNVFKTDGLLFLSPARSSLARLFCSTIFLLRILLFLSTVPYCLWNVKPAEIKSFCFFSANTFHSSGYTVYPFLFYFSLFCDISAFGTPSIIALICFSAQKIKQPANKKHHGFFAGCFLFFSGARDQKPALSASCRLE